MIAVIADDLTGAAEIGGIALRHQCSVVIDTGVHPHPGVDVMVIATDARSKTGEEAKTLIAEVTKQLIDLHPKFIFKKTDSLLRGNVGEELVGQMNASGKAKVLLVPANPSLGRTIKNGIYYADDVPLNESKLADAALNKITASGVLALLGERFSELSHVISLDDPLPEAGIMIGNTATESDLEAWAKKMDDSIIPAGGGDFFNAILKSRAIAKKTIVQHDIILGKKIVYLCGSAFPLSKEYVRAAKSQGRQVCYMPEHILCPGIDMQAMADGWVAAINKSLEQEGEAIIAVDDLRCSGIPNLSERIRELMALIIERVLQHTQINELVIEGGATAFSIIKRLHYERLFPVQELAQGVIRMKVHENEELFLTMKPGSYRWPLAIWKPT